MNPNELAKLQPDDAGGVPMLQPLGGALEHGARQGRSVQRTELGYTTAIRVAQPRDPVEVWSRVEQDARLLEEDAWYSIHFSGGKAEGGTIKLARSLASIWGNCAVNCRTVREERDGNLLLEASFVDLETGLNLALEYRGYMTAAPGKFADDPEQIARWKAMQFASQQSRAIRNVILAALPAWLVKSAIAEAKNTAASKLLHGDDLDVARHKLVKLWKDAGVESEFLDAWVGRPLAQWSPQDCVDLSAAWRAVQDGETTADQVFAGVYEHAQIIAKSGRAALNLEDQKSTPTPTATTATTASTTTATTTPTTTAMASKEPAFERPPPCPVCGKSIMLTLGGGLYRVHGPKENRCDGSGEKPPTTTATASTTTPSTTTATAGADAQDAGGSEVDDTDTDGDAASTGTATTTTATDQGSLALEEEPFEGM